MKHVIAIRIKDGQLELMPERYDSSQQMKDALPNGDYIFSAITTIDDESKKAEQNNQDEVAKQQQMEKENQRNLLLQQQQELAQKLAALG